MKFDQAGTSTRTTTLVILDLIPFPLGLKPEDPEELDVLITKELQNGRLVFVAVGFFGVRGSGYGKRESLSTSPHKPPSKQTTPKMIHSTT